MPSLFLSLLSVLYAMIIASQWRLGIREFCPALWFGGMLNFQLVVMFLEFGIWKSPGLVRANVAKLKAWLPPHFVDCCSFFMAGNLLSSRGSLYQGHVVQHSSPVVIPTVQSSVRTQTLVAGEDFNLDEHVPPR